MQRIVTSPILYSALSRAEHAQHHTVLQVCAPHLANLFACSREGGTGQLEWWSPLAGPVIPFFELSVVQQQDVRKIFNERKKALAILSEQLVSTGQNAVADTLHSVLHNTDMSRLYSVGNQPVVIDWYCVQGQGESVVPPITYVAADNAAMAMAASAARSAGAQPLKKTLYWPWFLLGLSLLALVIGAWQL